MNYEETQTETVEIAVETEETSEVDLSAFDAGWDNDDYTNGYEAEESVDEVESEEAEADQQEAEVADASNATEETEQSKEQEAKEADQRFELKHLDEVKEVGRDEVIALAQKGMDYDRKVPKLNSKIADYEAFLKELAEPSGLSIEELIDTTRARMLQTKEAQEGRELDDMGALLKVQSQRAESKKDDNSGNTTDTQTEQDTKRNNDAEFKRFIAARPDVKAENIPQSVWDAFTRTGDLLGSYMIYENAELQKKLNALETNKKNERRSTGSRKNSGSASPIDAFDEGWDSI